MNIIYQYGSVYKKFVETCFSEALSYRAHFVLLVIMDLVFYLTELGSVHIVFTHISDIGVWQEKHFLFFITFMLVIDQIHMSLFSEGFWSFSLDIRKGMLDFALIKPIGSIFIVFFRYIRPASMLNIIFTVPALIYFGNNVGLSTMSWVLLPFMIILALTLLVSLEILISTSMFWIVESMGVNVFRTQIQKVGRWPDFIYGYYMNKFFLYGVPILMVGSYPVKFLLDLDKISLVGTMIMTILILWVLIYYMWNLGLRRYESASS